MENGSDPKDPQSAREQDKPKRAVGDKGGGFGGVAQYIEAYGGLRERVCEGLRKRNRVHDEVPNEESVAHKDYDAGSFNGKFSSFHDYSGKYPQSCAKFVRWDDPRLSMVFSYLREKEWSLQNDLVRKEDDKEYSLGALEAIEAVLIWVATNIRGKKR